jgi:uncharacterized protein YjbJ (UPF0337 family)
MNWSQVEGQWKVLKGKAREKWGKLTSDDIEQIRGRRDELLGRLQKRYGDSREDLERQVDEWVRTLDERQSPRA